MFEWMAWTMPTALFFIAVAMMLVVMTVYAIRNRPAARRGFLPIDTTPGDRMFIALLSGAFIHLAGIGLFNSLPLWTSSLAALAWATVLISKG